MNLNNWSPAEIAKLRAFYDAGQGWTFAAISAGADAPTLALRNWLEQSPPPRGNPLLLPMVKPGASDARWYAIAFSDAQAEALRAELNAFLGPVGSDYSGRRAVVDTSDPVDVAAFDWAGGAFVYRFDVLAGSRAVVRAALDRLQQVWRLRPTRPGFVFRTTAALLREFFTALGNNDPVASQRWLTEINQSGRLSAENAKFLEIERLGAHGQWDEIALHSQLPLLTAIRRPRRITGLLLESLWRAELAKFAEANQPAEAIAYMKASYLVRHEGLLRTRSGLTEPSAVLTFLLAAAALPARAGLVPALVALTKPDTNERKFAEAVAARVAPSESKPVLDPIAQIRASLAASDYDAAWAQLQALPNGIEVCAIALDCAAEIYTEEVARAALAKLDSLSESKRQELLQRRRSLARVRDDLRRLVAAAGVPAVNSWESWLEKVSADPDWSEIVNVAQVGAGAWGLAPYQSNPARVRRLAEQIHTLSTAAWRNARFATPHLVRFFMPEGVPVSAFAPVYQSLLLILALDDQFGSEDWALTQSLANGILEAGLDAKGYEDLLNGLELIWAMRGETTRLDWALDLLDTLIASPVLVPPALDKFFLAVCGTFRTHPRRITAEHRTLFRLMCVDLKKQAEFEGLPVLPAAEAVPSQSGAAKIARGNIVGIYTLTVSAAARAKALLEAQFEGIDVRLNDDHGGSPRLESLAKESDYLVVVTKSAKHAATDFIKAKRPRTKSELIYPTGRGASSIVSALLRALDRTA